MDTVKIELISQLEGGTMTPVVLDVTDSSAGCNISIASSSFSSEVVSPELELALS